MHSTPPRGVRRQAGAFHTPLKWAQISHVGSRLLVARVSGASGSAQRARPPGQVGQHGLDEAGAKVPGVAQLAAVAGAAPAVSTAVTRGG
jgi:hypothetical protein